MKSGSLVLMKFLSWLCLCKSDSQGTYHGQEKRRLITVEEFLEGKNAHGKNGLMTLFHEVYDLWLVSLTAPYRRRPYLTLHSRWSLCGRRESICLNTRSIGNMSKVTNQVAEVASIIVFRADHSLMNFAAANLFFFLSCPTTPVFHPLASQKIPLHLARFQVLRDILTRSSVAISRHNMLSSMVARSVRPPQTQQISLAKLNTGVATSYDLYTLTFPCYSFAVGISVHPVPVLRQRREGQRPSNRY